MTPEEEDRLRREHEERLEREGKSRTRMALYFIVGAAIFSMIFMAVSLLLLRERP